MSAATRITNGLVQEWIEQFLEKNKDYSGASGNGVTEPSIAYENADVLGIRGQFAEVWRKVWKLKKGMWDGQELVGEQPREILLDMIGHCFLAIDMLDRQTGPLGKTVLRPDEEPDPRLGIVSVCGLECNAGHTYIGKCGLRRASGHRDA